jgi:hypothetical protein
MTKAAERFFTKIANDVLEASEQIAARMEEGLGVVFGGAGGQQPAEPGDETATPTAPGDEEEADVDMEELLRNNPLRGMTESVLQGIMQGQVSNKQGGDQWPVHEQSSC